MPLIVVCAERALSCVQGGDGLAGWSRRLEVRAKPCALQLLCVPGSFGDSVLVTGVLEGAMR